VSIHRHLPRYATADETFEYYITVSNQGDRVERDLRLEDNPRSVAPSFEQFRHAREPGEETRNAWDRWIGFHRFMWLQRHNTGIVAKDTEVSDIGRKASVDVKVEALALRRGVVHFQSTTIFHPDPLGLNYGLTEFQNPCQLLILPKRYRLGRRLDLNGGRHFQPGGVNPTWSIGESHEFVSLRDYRDGDSPRKIHWASTAKRDKPVVREFQDEYFVRQALVVDTAIDDPGVLEEVIAVTASFVFDKETGDTLLDLLYVSDKPEILTAGRGYAYTNQQLEALAGMGQSKSDFTHLAQAVIQHAGLLSSCILVLGGWNEDRRKLLERLRAMNLPVEAFVVRPDASLEEELKGLARLLPVDEIQDRLSAI
jgi:uncharacterized protein (DUF58 family)